MSKCRDTCFGKKKKLEYVSKMKVKMSGTKRIDRYHIVDS